MLEMMPVNQLSQVIAQATAPSFLLGAVAGLWLGAWLAVARFPGHRGVVWALNTLLAAARRPL